MTSHCNWETMFNRLAKLAKKFIGFGERQTIYQVLRIVTEIRDVINKNLEQVSSFWTDFSQNKTLYKIFANLRRSISKKTHPQQHKVLCDYIRDFELAGAHLENDAQLNFKKNTIELNKTSSKVF